MTTQDNELLELLKKPENIKIALEIEQQSQFIRRQVMKEFGVNIKTILQGKLNTEETGKTWQAFSESWNNQDYMNVGIWTLKNQTKFNYRMVAELFRPQKYSHRWGWVRPDGKNKSSETADIKDLIIKMIDYGCNVGDGFWLGSKDLKAEKIGFILTDIDDICTCLEDNRSDEHPLANMITEELWSMFITYRADIESLESFKQAASL